MEPPLQEQVIGVARDVKFGDLNEPVAYIDYLPYTQGHGALAISRCGIRDTSALLPATCSRPFTPSIAGCRSRTSRPSMNR